MTFFGYFSGKPSKKAFCPLHLWEKNCLKQSGVLLERAREYTLHSSLTAFIRL